MGFTRLRDLGQWVANNDFLTIFSGIPIPGGKWSEAQTRNWDLVGKALAGARIDMLFDSQPDLVLDCTARQAKAESIILAHTECGSLPPTAEAIGTGQWGSDGSMVPATAGILDEKSITAAVTGPRTVAMKLPGHNLSILQGELMGLVAGLVISGLEEAAATIHTDHLNSVRLVGDCCRLGDSGAKLQHINGRSYYRWILQLLEDKETGIHYTKGHAADSSLPTVLNNAADRHAVDAQSSSNVRAAPTPTFFMDRFTFYQAGEGWIESNIRTYFDRILAHRTATDMEHEWGLCLRRLVYDRTSPPNYP
ncbi:hypothetical protein C0992_004074, partial [Termitomyces sp. T32_za158]